jgi:hypothetical protein
MTMLPEQRQDNGAKIKLKNVVRRHRACHMPLQGDRSHSQGRGSLVQDLPMHSTPLEIKKIEK